ncbi:MAG: branched-chain amino acid ABC transporter permease [Ramlibacter sp.]
MALLVALTLPLWAGGIYYVNLASQVLIAAIFALSLNLLVGYAGLVSLGQAAWLGLSAYVSAWVMLNLGWGHGAAAVTAIAATTAIAGLFGVVALRASGISFLMITLAFGQIVWGVAYRWADITGGDNGLSGLARPSPFGLDLGNPTSFYYFSLAALALVWAGIAAWVHSPFGASIRATRDQPRRASALGFNVWLIRWITFTMSGFLGAVGGLMYVYYHQFISPHSVSLANSAEMLLMVIAGGPGSLVGPVLGAGMVVLLKNLASVYVDRWTMLLGFVYLFIVLFVPGGIIGGLGRLEQRLRRSRRARSQDPVEATAAPESAGVPQ